MSAVASKAKKPHIQENSIERHTTETHTKSVSGSLSDVSADVFSNLWNDLITGGSKDVSTQIFGSAGGSHDMKPGQEHSLKKQPEKKAAAPRTEAHMEYFRTVKNADVAPERQKDIETKSRVDEIRMEIKKLMDASQELEATFKTVHIEQRVIKAGSYHETFLTFILSLLRSARVKMQEGASWMNTTKNKKKQQQYQSMAKKHGTSFTLNNERTVATQTG